MLLASSTRHSWDRVREDTHQTRPRRVQYMAGVVHKGLSGTILPGRPTRGHPPGTVVAVERECVFESVQVSERGGEGE